MPTYKIKIQFISLIMIVTIIESCNNNSIHNNSLTKGISVEGEITSIHINIPKPNTLFKTSQVLDTTYLIPLVTGDDSKLALGEILQIEFYNGEFYVLHDTQPEPKLFVFDTTGLFKRQIGKIGGGPEEYMSLNSFSINPYNETVDIIGYGEVARYLLNGNFKERIKHELHFREATAINDSTYALYTSKMLNFVPSTNTKTGYDTTTFDIIYTDNIFKIIDSQFPFVYSKFKGISFHNLRHFKTFGNEHHLMIALNDTSYVFDKNTKSFIPKYQVSFDKEPKEELYHLTSQGVRDELLKKPKYAYMVSQFWRLKNTIFLEYIYNGWEYVAYINTKTNAVITGNPSNDSYGYYPNTYCITPDAFVGKVSYDELEAAYSEYEENSGSEEVIKKPGGLKSAETMKTYLNKYPDVNQFLSIMIPKEF